MSNTAFITTVISICTAFVGAMGLVAHILGSRIGDLATQVQGLSTRITGLDGRLAGVEGKLERIDERTGRIVTQLDQHDARLIQIERPSS